MRLSSWNNQPAGLYVYSFMEMWERLGFYAIQAILVLYLVHQLKFSDQHAYAVYTAFTGLLYAGPVIGGIIADKWMTLSRAIYLGIILYIFGYFLLIIHSRYAFYFAFSLLIGGNCYLKANISALLGTLYEKNDIRRDSGFTLFYFGINLGQAIGPIAASIAIKYYGYNAAFFVSGISLIICYGVFWLGQKYLNLKTKNNLLENVSTKLNMKDYFIYIFTIIFLIFLAFFLPYENIINLCLIIFAVLAVIYLMYCLMNLNSRKERYSLFSLIILFVFSAIYWGIWMQMFTSMLLFVDRNVNKIIFGWEIPTSMLISFEAIGIILFAPLLARLWLKLGKSRFQPSFSLKFGYGFLFTGLSFGLLVMAINWFSDQNYISCWWVIFSLFLLAIGEVCLSAIGLSAVTALTPSKLTGTMMGFWFLTVATGLVIADKMANLSLLKNSNLSDNLKVYSQAFTVFMLVSFIIFVVLLILTPVIKRFSGENENVIDH